MRKFFKISLVVFAVAILAGEVVLSQIGFGKPPLYKSDKDFEYINIPNQKIDTLAFNYETNQYSMRGKTIGEIERERERERVILVGDSVLNGGRYISNTELVNTVLGQKYPNIDFLNISAGSWGADNAFEYIKKYGHYEAKKIVMVFSSHDAGDCIEHNTVLGNSQFPTQKPCCAWGEFLEKIYLKFKPRDFSNEHGITKNIKGCEFNSGWNDFVKYSRDNNISLYSVLHAETSEIDAQEYSENGQKLIMFFEENNIKYVLDLNKTDKKYYRDSIHFNEDGHKFLADLISGLLESE